MKMGNRKSNRAVRRVALVALILCIPGAMGGCPEFRNETVAAFETAARGLIDAAIDLAFDQLRTDDIS